MHRLEKPVSKKTVRATQSHLTQIKKQTNSSAVLNLLSSCISRTLHLIPSPKCTITPPPEITPASRLHLLLFCQQHNKAPKHLLLQRMARKEIPQTKHSKTTVPHSLSFLLSYLKCFFPRTIPPLLDSHHGERVSTWTPANH